MSDEHKKTRGAIKSSLTRFSNYFDYVKDNPEHVDILELESRLKQVETLIDQFNSVQLKIEQEDKDFEQNEDSVHAIQREEFETKFFKVTSAVKRFIQSSQPSSSVDQQQTQTYNLINSPDIKLPSLNIPNFDGSYDQWLFFRDTFCSLIHNNNSLSPIQKFHYLRLSLKGSAADVIKSLSISSENYQIAWQLLEERYENKQYIVNNHIKAIFELPIALKESHSNLRQILDGIQKHLRALDVLNLPVNQWDALLIYLITSKLDNTTLREWSLRTKSNELPTMTDFIQFLKDRCRLLESLENSNLDKSKHNHNNRQNSSNKSFLANKAFTAKCSFCSKNHSIYSCADFSNLSPQNRFNEVRRLNLCVNCLKSGHNVSACKSSFCRTCGKPHHTFLHFPTNISPSAAVARGGSGDAYLVNGDSSGGSALSLPSDVAGVSSDSVVLDTNTKNLSHHAQASQILLATALVYILDTMGQTHECRVLLDSGSTNHFMSQNLCDKLGLRKQKIDFNISGIAQSDTRVQYKTVAKILSKFNGFKIALSCLVLPTITGIVPATSFNANLLNLPNDIKLADPNFNKANQIDLLIGADLFWDLLCIGQIKLGRNRPILQKTKLGWIISGPLLQNTPQSGTCNLSLSTLENALTKFWELEEIPNKKFTSHEEEVCERHFTETVSQHADGHFIVSIPLKQPKILWRFDPSLDIDTFELNTVTYGTASAAFLAIRSLQEVAHIHQHTNPHVCKVIINDFYVDDLLTGCDTTDQAIKLKSELSDLLSGHGFILRKWTSNDVQIQNSSPASLQIGTDQPNKTLGILWTPTQDILQYSISQPDTSARVSKRQILSCIAQIFDPLGLLAPVTITSKLILQELWKLNISWDESIPSNLYTIWTNYRAEFVQLNAINFPRHVSCRSPVSIQLHGFSDASERAYGAVVYIRSLDTQGNCFVNILCAKTRVAPLKPITIPRLELCGALLLAQLMSKVKESMNIDFDNIFYWTDSQIVLCWLNTSPHTLKTFVANRSSQMLQKILQHFWTRWSKEYVSHLQHRTKWKTNGSQAIKVGSLVIIKEDGLPPLKWRIGRISQLHPGSDTIVRTVTVKTSTGEYRRPMTKIAILPTSEPVETLEAFKEGPFYVASNPERDAAAQETTAQAPIFRDCRPISGEVRHRTGCERIVPKKPK
nr:unnamed protein product [Callosobruchus analis]